MSNFLILAIGSVLALLTLAGCGGSSGGAVSPVDANPVTVSSGVQGLVTNVVVGGAPPPPNMPAPQPTPQTFPGAIITVQASAGGPEVARAVSDAQGRYRIPLSPGNYLLVPLSNPPANAHSIPIVVPAGLYIDQPVQYTTNAP